MLPAVGPFFEQVGDLSADRTRILDPDCGHQFRAPRQGDVAVFDDQGARLFAQGLGPFSAFVASSSRRLLRRIFPMRAKLCWLKHLFLGFGARHEIAEGRVGVLIAISHRLDKDEKGLSVGRRNALVRLGPSLGRFVRQRLDVLVAKNCSSLDVMPRNAAA